MSLYKQPNTPHWWENVSVPGHERLRRSTGTDDREKAQRVHDELKASLWEQPTLKGRTWGKAVMLWVDAAERSDSELLSLAKFGSKFKDRLLTDVTRESVHTALSFCKTAGTYTRYRTMLAAILNLAKEEGWLRDVPKLVTRTDKKTKPRKWLTHEQWSKLHDELPSHQRAAATLAVRTGLRQSNVLSLRWANVDLERRLIWVEAEDTKGNAALSVPLSVEAIEVLEGTKGLHDEFVFTYHGKPIKEVKTAFQAACVRAGVGHYVGGVYSGFTWHGLRHTWATWHVQNGTPLDVLQKLGGWSDLRMLMNYAHHSPGHLARFADNTKGDKYEP